MKKLIYILFIFLMSCNHSVEKLKIERNDEGFLKASHENWDKNLEFACVADITLPVYDIDRSATILYLYDCFKTLKTYDIKTGRGLYEYIFKPVDRHAVDYKLRVYEDLVIFSSNHHLWVFDKELNYKSSLMEDILENNRYTGEYNWISYSINNDKIKTYFIKYKNIGSEHSGLKADTISFEYKISLKDGKLRMLPPPNPSM